MKKYFWTLVTVSLWAGGAGLLFGAETIVKDANVPYPFTAAGHALPAGHYEILKSDDPEDAFLILRDTATGERTIVEYLTRSAAREDGRNTIVFDVAGGQRYLSEIHLADSDGYLLPGTRGAHTHSQVRAAKKS